ncbi:MAG: hypothetical protein GXO18_07765 [Aquificae bacterium]|nr:hypothetical protein [Aquificota bacterium]
MVETPKLSSLAGELLKFFIFSSLLLGATIALILFFIGKLNPYYSVGIGFAVAFGWVIFNIIWTKNKLEELFGRLLYVIEILEERHKERMVVPIPLHEEVLDIIRSIKELVKSFEDRYEREIKSLEEQIENISENAARVLTALEKAQEGYINVEFPSGLDPVGAIGQAVQHTLEEYQSRFLEIKKNLAVCDRELHRILSLIDKKEDKIDFQEVKEGIERIKMAEEQIEKALEFIKEY